MLPNFDATSFILTVGALILGVALAIAAAGWLVGRVFPALRLLAPFAIAALACWRAALAFPKGDQIGYFVIPFVLAGAAVAVGRVLRAPAEPRLGVGAAARILFIGSAAIYGALHMGPGNVVTGVLGIAAACAVTSIWDAERRAPVARGSGAQRRAIGLSLLALVVAALPAPPVVEGLPEELRMLHAALAIQVAAAAALAGGAALLLVRQARRGRDLLLVEALVVTLSLSGAAARALWWRPGALSRLGQLAVASITFEPPRGWGEVRGSPAPLRLYERNDRKESVTAQWRRRWRQRRSGRRCSAFTARPRPSTPGPPTRSCGSAATTMRTIRAHFRQTSRAGARAARWRSGSPRATTGASSRSCTRGPRTGGWRAAPRRWGRRRDRARGRRSSSSSSAAERHAGACAAPQGRSRAAAGRRRRDGAVPVHHPPSAPGVVRRRVVRARVELLPLHLARASDGPVVEAKERVDGRSPVVTIRPMTRLAQRVGRRARLAVLCVGLAAAGMPAHALASADPVVAAAVEVSPAPRRADRLPRPAPAIAAPTPAPRRSQRQTADADTARPCVPCTPLFITHRALLR